MFDCKSVTVRQLKDMLNKLPDSCAESIIMVYIEGEEHIGSLNVKRLEVSKVITVASSVDSIKLIC